MAVAMVDNSHGCLNPSPVGKTTSHNQSTNVFCRIFETMMKRTRAVRVPPPKDQGLGVSNFPVSDGPAPKLEVCRNVPRRNFPQTNPPPPPVGGWCASCCWWAVSHPMLCLCSLPPQTGVEDSEPVAADSSLGSEGQPASSSSPSTTSTRQEVCG